MLDLCLTIVIDHTDDAQMFLSRVIEHLRRPLVSQPSDRISNPNMSKFVRMDASGPDIYCPHGHYWKGGQQDLLSHIPPHDMYVNHHINYYVHIAQLFLNIIWYISISYLHFHFSLTIPSIIMLNTMDQIHVTDKF